VGLILGLNPRNLPQPGTYEGGRLQFGYASSASGLWILTVDPATGAEQWDSISIPYEVQLGTVGVEFSPRSWRALAVGPKQAEDSLELSVKASGDAAAAGGAGPPTVELVRADVASSSFSPQELGFERASDAVSATAAPSRTQKMTLQGFEEPIRVFFQPDPARHADSSQLVGKHRYLLRATGPGLDPAERPLELIVEPPQIDVKHAADVEYCVPPGSQTPPIRHQVRLRWLPGGKLPLALYPPYRTIPFHLIRDGLETEETIAVPYTGVEQPLVLEAADTSDPLVDAGWKDLEFVLRVPPARQMTFGRYAGALELRFQGQTYDTFRFRLKVDGIYTLHPIVASELRERFAVADVVPERTSRVRLLQFFDQPTKATVEVRGELNEDLNAEDLQVRFVGPFLPDGGGPVLMRTDADRGDPVLGDFLPLPLCTKNDIRAEPSGALQVDFHFPRVASGYHRQSYYVDVSFQYHEDSPLRDLGETLLRFEVVRLDPHKIITAKPAASR
jgi:hypothetical protein